MEQEKLKEILRLHKLWLRGDKNGARAYLRGADLGGADLSEADLRRADLIEADLGGADLSEAYLSGADLRGADLSEANLIGADLRRAYLSEADLSEAYLRRADLSEAYLSGADLRRADLSGADLSEADLRGADLREAKLDYSCWPLHCGSFRAKAGDRLVLQLFSHITRLDVSGCSKPVQKLVEKLPKLAKDGFCQYRPDVHKLCGAE